LLTFKISRCRKTKTQQRCAEERRREAQRSVPHPTPHFPPSTRYQRTRSRPYQRTLARLLFPIPSTRNHSLPRVRQVCTTAHPVPCPHKAKIRSTRCSHTLRCNDRRFFSSVDLDVGGGDSMSSFCRATLRLRGLLWVVELHHASRLVVFHDGRPLARLIALALLHTLADEAGDDDDQEQSTSASTRGDADDRAGVVGFGRSLWR